MAPWNSSMPERIEDEIFTQQDASHEIREESDCLCRYCCHQFRELKMGIFPPNTVEAGSSMGYEETGWPTNISPMLVMERPFKCPLLCCCFMPWPFEMSVNDPLKGGQHLGKAVYDFKWYNCCIPCEQHMNLFDSEGNLAYVVHSPLCCGGCMAPDGHNRCCANCCAPTCFATTFTSTIHDANTRAHVGTWENQWPGCNTRGICQLDSGASNYVVKFPQGASPPQKAIILTGVMLSKFTYFEQRANQK